MFHRWNTVVWIQSIHDEDYSHVHTLRWGIMHEWRSIKMVDLNIEQIESKAKNIKQE